MAVSKPNSYPETPTSETRRQKETSISAHIVRMGTVTMAFAELDILCEMLASLLREGMLTRDGEIAIAREFVEAVESIR